MKKSEFFFEEKKYDEYGKLIWIGGNKYLKGNIDMKKTYNYI